MILGDGTMCGYATCNRPAADELEVYVRDFGVPDATRRSMVLAVCTWHDLSNAGPDLARWRSES